MNRPLVIFLLALGATVLIAGIPIFWIFASRSAIPSCTARCYLVSSCPECKDNTMQKLNCTMKDETRIIEAAIDYRCNGKGCIAPPWLPGGWKNVYWISDVCSFDVPPHTVYYDGLFLVTYPTWYIAFGVTYSVVGGAAAIFCLIGICCLCDREKPRNSKFARKDFKV